MRFLLTAWFAFGLIVAHTPSSHAATCEQAASACVRSGVSQTKCYGDNIASCKRTCVYVGPISGKRTKTSGDCKPGK